MMKSAPVCSAVAAICAATKVWLCDPGARVRAARERPACAAQGATEHTHVHTCLRNHAPLLPQSPTISTVNVSLPLEGTGVPPPLVCPAAIAAAAMITTASRITPTTKPACNGRDVDTALLNSTHGLAFRCETQRRGRSSVPDRARVRCQRP